MKLRGALGKKPSIKDSGNLTQHAPHGREKKDYRGAESGTSLGLPVGELTKRKREPGIIGVYPGGKPFP